MPGERNDPYRNFMFRVELGDIAIASFSEATVPDSTTESTDYREGTDPTHQRKLSALTKYGSVTLKKGLTDSMDIYNWKKQVEETGALGARKDISLILIDEEGNDKARWNIVEAWPTKYDAPSLNATGNEIAIETLEIAHEGMKRTQ